MTRVSPMDVTSATRLLEEKELDLQLAAKIGQELLNRNRRLEEKIDALESQVTASTELITQLRHELSVKSDLLRVYTDDVVNADEDEYNDNDINVYASSEAEADQQHNVEVLERRIQALEKENRGLHEQALQLATEASEVESKEERLVSDAFKHLSEANVRIGYLNEQCAIKSDESSRQQQQITQLLAQICDLQKRQRDSNRRNEELTSSLEVYKEVQEELTAELLDVKEKYKEVLELLQDTQQQLKKATKHKYYFNNSNLSDYSNSPPVERGFASLQFELEATSNRLSESQGVNSKKNSRHHHQRSSLSSALSNRSSSLHDNDDDHVSYTVSRDHTHSPDLFICDRSMPHLTLENALKHVDHSDPLLVATLDNDDHDDNDSLMVGEDDDDDVVIGGRLRGDDDREHESEHAHFVVDQDVIEDEEPLLMDTLDKVRTVGQLQTPHYLASDGLHRQLGCVPGQRGGLQKLEGHLSDFESEPLSSYSLPQNHRSSVGLSRRSEGLRSRGSSDKLLEETLRRLTPEELERRRIKTFSHEDSASITSPTLSSGQRGLGVKSGHSGSFRLPSTVRVVKPLEGSLTLHHWQRLATPNLGNVLETRSGVATKFGRQQPITTNSSECSLSWLSSSSVGNTALHDTLTNSLVRHPQLRSTVTNTVTSTYLPQSSIRMNTGFKSRVPSESYYGSSGQMIGLQEVLEERSIGCWTGSTWSLASHNNKSLMNADVMEENAWSLTPSVMCSPKALSMTNTPLNSPTKQSAKSSTTTFGFLASVRAAIYGEQQKESQKSKRTFKKFGILEKVEEVGVENLLSTSLTRSVTNSNSSSREASVETTYSTSTEFSNQTSDELEVIQPGSLTLTSSGARIKSLSKEGSVATNSLISRSNNEIPSPLGVPGLPGTGALQSIRSGSHGDKGSLNRMRTDLGSVPGREASKGLDQGFIGSVTSMLFGKKGGLW